MFQRVHRFDAAETVRHLRPRTAEEACSLLIQGNRDFVQMTETRHSGIKRRVIPFARPAFDLGTSDASTSTQAPFAAVLGCADARVPTEMVFNKGCNELFVVRVAGNVLGRECVGSLRYAVSHFPSTLKLVVVLAHAQCGAVTEAVDMYLEPRRYLDIATDYSIRSIEDQIQFAVRVAALGMEALHGLNVVRQLGYRAALIEAAVVLNAAWSAYCLRQECRARFPEIGVVFGAYDLISRYVRLPLSLPGHLTEEEKGLFAPPEDAEGFRQLAARICSGELVKSHMA